MKRFVITCMTAAMLGAGCGAALAAGESDMALAQDALDDYRYGIALNHLRDAAAKGNLRAQRIAGHMLYAGEQLYGPEVKANRAEAEKWLALAAAGGCQRSQRLLAMSKGRAGAA